MQYIFDTAEAQKYGVEEAIMLSNFKFWIAKNKANEKNFFDGRYWTYNSKKAFAKLFPFWSEKQIKRILKSLIDQNVLITGNYNENKFDKTLWYAFKYESIILNEPIEQPNQSTPLAQTGQSYTDNKLTDNKPDIKLNNTPYIPPKGEIVEELFSPIFKEFWEEYPKQRRGDKNKAYKAWQKVLRERRATEQQMLAVCKIYAVSDEVAKGFAKGCAAWLNDSRFLTDYTISTGNTLKNSIRQLMTDLSDENYDQKEIEYDEEEN